MAKERKKRDVDTEQIRRMLDCIKKKGKDCK